MYVDTILMNLKNAAEAVNRSCFSSDDFGTLVCAMMNHKSGQPSRDCLAAQQVRDQRRRSVISVHLL